ncbi:MAG: porin [Verrucomicrobia bacterium]|nr:porin [Verrucomicrobiota bacterium]
MRKARLFTMLALLGIVVIGPAQRAVAQGAGSPKQGLEERLQSLEEELKRLQPLEQELKTLKSQLEAQKTAVAEKEAAAAQKAQAVEQDLKILKRQREVEKEAELAAAEKRAKETPILTVGSKGISVKSADGNFGLKLGGQFKADSRTFLEDNGERLTDTFSINSARLIFDGTLFKEFEFRLAPEFGNGSTQLIDGYIDWKHWNALKLRAGKTKGPVGLERLQSDVDNQFVSLGFPSSLVPNRDIGLQLYGDLLEGTLSYAVGVFNGTPDGASVDVDEHDSKDIDARVFAHPFKKTDLKPVQGLGVGIAGSTGNRQGTATSSALPTFKTPGQSTFFTYNTGAYADGVEDRISPQGYYYWGPFGLLGEYVVSSQEARRVANSQRIQNAAWQVAASYVLTGEDASYKGVTPDKPFSLAKGQWGAFEITARVHELDVDDAAFVGTVANRLADPTVSATKTTAWGVGLNWYLSKNVKLMIDYEQTRFEGGAGAGASVQNRQDEKAVFGRLQVVF